MWARRSRRTLVLTGLVAVALAAGGAVAVHSGTGLGGQSGRDEPGATYDRGLLRYGPGGVANSFYAFPASGGGLSFGSPDGHTFVVQFRDPRGSGWTAPRTIYRSPDDLGIVNTVDGDGDVVVLRQNLVDAASLDSDDDSDTGDIEVLAVCRPTSCAHAVRLPAGVERLAPQIAEDGRGALLGVGEGALVVWTPDSGIRIESTTGVPAPGRRGSVEVSAPSLAPDGIVRIVRSTVVGSGCEFVLLTGRAGVGVQVTARETSPELSTLRPRSCSTSLGTFRLSGAIPDVEPG